ncbi:MAG: tryptophan synthase subunit alpha, partial [Methanomicrobiales archaeon]|nr:tryptophan synthase subunit alpha [Methanomicrobiales archaeon]
MKRLSRIFQGRDHPAFIAFLVAGDPEYAASVSYAKAIIDAGADVLELGMPFSDPVADGSVIQEADERALAAGMTPDLLFSLLREIRNYSEIPLVILTYYNSVFTRGVARFYEEAAAAGADAILIVDLPVEESEEVVAVAQQTGIDPIFLVTATTSEERLSRITSRAGGFLYLVSTLGVTGMREDRFPHIEDLIRTVRKTSLLPIAVGFGISR